MTSLNKLLKLCIMSAASMTAIALPDSATITQAELVHRTQQLYDALVPGDRAPWINYYADDAMMYDEKGRSMDKRALVADVKPLPAGYGGTLKIVHPHTIFSSGVAILAYDCDEKETIFGQEMHARYHSVDTWLYRHGKWQIAASQTMRYYEDPAMGTTGRAHLSDYTGTYELSPNNLRIVTSEGSDLFLQRANGPEVKLLPEAGDLFFRKGIEGRIFFHRTSAGTVDALYDRRNNEDVVWKRLPTKPAALKR